MLHDEIMSLRLESDLKEQFWDYCNEVGLKPTELIRAYMWSIIEGGREVFFPES